SVSEQRKVVTILFADVVGSTEIASQRDPVVVRSMMSRYFKRIGEISATYGGTVEKFAGDAAMVVFGVPSVHDDDPERAVRAALEIRDAAAELAVRVGVNTGEAVTATTEDRQFMVSGDTVNVAARLQQGADPGEVLVGALTHLLTRNAIEYETREPVPAKRKSEPLVARRAVRPRTEVPVQSRGIPGLQAAPVGRSRELRPLLDTYSRSAERVEREIGWAVRHYLEAIARNAPLVAVIDDVQWAEPPVVSLIEELAERVTDVPVLIICMARPEFLESRGGWSAGKPNSTTITLDPLNPQETSTLVSRLLEIEALPDELRRQIVERSAGTPLFCEELIHMLVDEGLVVRDGASWRATATIDQIRVPQGINAVLAARLDL